MDILEELWRGDVLPYSSIKPPPETTVLMDCVVHHHEKLTANLTGELKETFEKLDDYWHECAELGDKERFAYAFHFRMQIALAGTME